MSAPSSSTASSPQTPLDALTKEISGFAEYGKIETGWFEGWRGRKIVLGNKKISEKDLWKKLETQAAKFAAEKNIRSSVVLCEKKLLDLHEKIELTPVGRLQRFLDWLFGVRASVEKETRLVLKALNIPDRIE